MRLFVVSCIAISLMFVDRQFENFKIFRMQLSMVVYPIQKMVDFPMSSYFLMRDYFLDKQTLAQDNKNLHAEQLLLNGKLQKFAGLEAENSRLKALLNAPTSDPTKVELIVANVLQIEPDPFMQQIILDKGIHNEVYIGQPIIDANGIMGSVIEVNQFTSRVMLLTDASHAVPVENVRNSVRAIAMGNGSTDHLDLKHVTNTADMAIGDVFVTSGLDGHYPAGYPVGTVINIEHDASNPFATVALAPSAQLERGRQVLLIKPRETTSDQET